MAKTAANSESEQTFESALTRLEAIVQQMDSPTLPLDQLITDYEEGVKLVKICQAKVRRTPSRSRDHNPPRQPIRNSPPSIPRKNPTTPKPTAARKEVRLF